MPSPLTLVTWNVLAAPWAAPAFYPADLDAALLERRSRAELVGGVLAALGAEMMCLQETTPPDLAITLARLGGAYDHVGSSNGRDLWTHWSTPECPWEPNGTAIVWRRDAFTEVHTDAVPISDDGNVATVLSARHAASGRQLRVMSVHLDADDATIRRRQLPRVLAAFGPASGAIDPATVDVVAGDCNEDTIGTDLGTISDDHGFTDALTELNCTDPTHPYARPSDDYAPLARLDHVLVRGATAVDGRVVDSGVWGVDGPGARLAAHLEMTGSDHLPVSVSLSC